MANGSYGNLGLAVQKHVEEEYHVEREVVMLRLPLLVVDSAWEETRLTPTLRT